MKNTGKCPKCESRDVIRIPAVKGGYGAGNVIPIGVTIFGSVKVTRYLCGQCGFIEEWIDETEKIDKVRRRYNS